MLKKFQAEKTALYKELYKSEASEKRRSYNKSAQNNMTSQYLSLFVFMLNNIRLVFQMAIP